MGPRLVERGKVGAGADGCCTRMLQWGRAWLSAERQKNVANEKAQPELQWGRAWLSAERLLCWLATVHPKEASMGPRLVERGKALDRAVALGDGVSFNGAALG